MDAHCLAEPYENRNSRLKMASFPQIAATHEGTNPMINDTIRTRRARFALIAVGLLMIGGLIALVCRPSRSERTKNNIFRVLTADRTLYRQVENTLPSSVTPSVLANAVDQYCDGLEALDMSDCPADFRVAYQNTRGRGERSPLHTGRYPIPSPAASWKA